MFSVWKPLLPESSDGKPLATSLSDLWTDFPYDRLPQDSQFWNLFLKPESMLGLLLFYLVSKPLFGWIYQHFVNPKSMAFRVSVAIHNLVLAIFSFAVAWNSWPVVIQHLQNHGLFETYCDPHGTLWNSGFGAWTFIFYISKYYEFVDTWILVLKGKEPSFLQIYHHTGIAFCMWVGVLSQSSWLKYVVLLNSIIHTLMYTYFFIKTVDPTIEIKAAKNLTMAQIGQFFTGIFLSFPVLIMGEKCDTATSRFGLACLQVYGYGLVALFMAFAKRKYKKTS